MNFNQCCTATLTELGLSDVCYVVRGEDSNGNPWMTRLFIGEGQYPLESTARIEAGLKAIRMNRIGANVKAVRQTHGDQGWVDDVRPESSECVLDAACKTVFGGVGACSPEIYETLIEKVATMCGRETDDKFREDVKNAISKLPCPMD